ncbi:MAG: penicillin-binding protein 2 [Patescibacteria group bacterium]
MRSSFRTRIQIIYALFFLFATVAFVRLFYLQVLHGDAYRALADRQYAQPSGGAYDRGTILFAEKDGALISAATLSARYSITINPSVIVDPPALYEQLSTILDLNKDIFLEKATRKNDLYELVAKGLSQETAERVRVLGVPGVGVFKENVRTYPAGALAAHVLGFVGLSKDSGPYPIGRYGIEKLFQTLLSRSTSSLSLNFFAELFGNLKDTVVDGDLEPEGDVVLTIEPTVQAYLERQLALAREKWGADAAGGVIIEPKTGKIVGMAALPTFDPNEFGKVTDVAVFSNPLIENVYEMGSIVKPLTMAAALDAGVVKLSTTYNDTGSIELDGKKISNFDGKARGVIPIQEILSQSLNVGSVFIEQSLGRSAFRTYFRGYGLGEKTGIDLPNELAGLIRNLDSTREVELATASFGQGIAVTPIEIVRALAALANGGLLMRPYVVEKVVYKAGVERVTAPEIQGRVLKEETTRTISKMLTEVVDLHLAKGKVKMEHYSVAAKTGTAQMANPKEGGYYSDRYLHSFFGYFPSQNARFLTFLYIVYPKGVQYSSETLTEPFENITKFLIQYYAVPPDR